MENLKKSNINSSPFNSFQEEEIKSVWQPAYTWVLVINAVYVVVFYLLMKFL